MDRWRAFTALSQNSETWNLIILREYGQELLNGHFLLAIETDDEAKRFRALNILQAHGGRINFYGKWQVTGLAS